MDITITRVELKLIDKALEIAEAYVDPNVAEDVEAIWIASNMVRDKLENSDEE